MSVTQRFRQAVADREAGAVAVIVAICSVVLFGVAALVIDIGSAYARRRAAQTDADLAALAGAAGLPDPIAAFNLAYDYLARNVPYSDGSGKAIPTKVDPVWTDGDETNGEITISNGNTRIRVSVPNRQVDFGFAKALPGGGYAKTQVRAAATAEIRSPAHSLPFYLTNGDNGLTCLHDNSNGGGHSAMRAVLLAPTAAKPSLSSMSPITATEKTAVTINPLTGKNFVAGGTSVSFTPTAGGAATTIAAGAVSVTTGSPDDTAIFTTPATMVAGTYAVTVTTSAGTSGSLTFTFTPAASPTPTPTPTVSPTPAPAMITAVSPNHGPTAGGTAVTLTGVNFTGVTGVKFDGVAGTNVVVVSDTQITVTAPGGISGPSFSVVLTGRAQTLNAPNDYYTYDAVVAPPTCPGDSSNRGYGDIPRNDGRSGTQRLLFNIAHGIDPALTVHPLYLSLPAGYPECDTLSGSLTTLPTMNCIPVQTGQVSGFEKGFFGDNPVDNGGRMRQTTSADSKGNIAGSNSTGDVDVDRLSTYLNVSLSTFLTAVTTGAPPTAGWVKPEIALCPRFAILPIINAPTNPPSGNHTYPIIGFKGFFIDDDQTDASFDHGFQYQGGSLRVVKGYAFDLRYADGVVSNGTVGTVTYVGVGPKIPVLIHDLDDPSY